MLSIRHSFRAPVAGPDALADLRRPHALAHAGADPAHAGAHAGAVARAVLPGAPATQREEREGGREGVLFKCVVRCAQAPRQARLAHCPKAEY